MVKHLLPFLAFVDDERTIDRVLVDVDEALMLRFVATKQAERSVLQDIAESLAELDSDVRGDLELLCRQLDPEEWRLLCRCGQRGGDRMVLDPAASGLISLSSRGLSNNEINRCLARMRDIARMANRRYKLGLDDPTQGCALPRRDPSREWLHPVQLQALLDAAQTLDANPAQDAYKQHGRYSAILALGLLGPRVSEFCAARWRDLSAEGLFIPEAKTSSARRQLELPTIVRTALDRRRAELDPRPSDWIWASAAGTRRDRNNVRNRLLAPLLKHAAELLEERGQRPLPAHVDADGNPIGVRVTPHMFRRTALTYWAWADRSLTASHSTSSSGRPVRVWVRFLGVGLRPPVPRTRAVGVADGRGAQLCCARLDPRRRQLVARGELLGCRVLGSVGNAPDVVALLPVPAGQLGDPPSESVGQLLDEPIGELVGQLI